MANKVEIAKENEVFNSIVRYLDSIKWKYEKFEDDLVIRSTVKGDDFPIEFLILLREKQQLVQFYSKLPFKVPSDQMINMAVAVCVANQGLIDGSFDYDLAKGEISFRLTTSYRESTLGEELFGYLIYVSTSTVDLYNDRFFMLSKGTMTLEQFIEADNAE